VQGVVQGAVTTSVEPGPHGAATAGGQGAGAGEGGERCVVAASTGVGERHVAWAALTGPMPRRSINPGVMSLTMVCSWARLALSSRAAAVRASAGRRISACRTARSRLASRGGRRRARLVRQVWARAAGKLTIGVVPAQQQRS
jgi:hypothetical protein